MTRWRYRKCNGEQRAGRCDWLVSNQEDASDANAVACETFESMYALDE